MPKTLTPQEIDDFRSRACEVAEAMFAAHGPDGVTMRELADALGVSAMTPYRYFTDKDAILAAVRTRAFTRFAEAMEVAARTYDPDAPPGEAYITFALGNPASYRMMFDVHQPTFDKYPDLLAAMQRARHTMGRGARMLRKTDDDSDLVAHMFWSALHGAVMLELGGLLPPPIDARAIIRPTIAALAEKLLKR